MKIKWGNLAQLDSEQNPTHETCMVHLEGPLRLLWREREREQKG